MCCIYIKRLQNGITCAVPLVGVQMGFTVRRHTTAADENYVAGSGLIKETDATCVGAGLKSSVMRCRCSSVIAEGVDGLTMWSGNVDQLVVSGVEYAVAARGVCIHCVRMKDENSDRRLV